MTSPVKTTGHEWNREIRLGWNPYAWVSVALSDPSPLNSTATRSPAVGVLFLQGYGAMTQPSRLSLRHRE